ncbi:hypothetical protein [Tenacibaculum singaporense]|uniref:hypothetical protein n=1 Tax=Tenacibaculum singaporense TaxID=2358479 RepID=UPI000F68767F|nr:hypothetical protein [Tenacibaculum singaporense]RSC96101.1 hypothetical protein EI424_02990 [Tenacibaculum singaporense]
MKTRNYEEENTYQIITFLTEDAKDFLVMPPVLSIPPLPNAKNYNTRVMTCQDSVRGYEYHYKQLTKKKTIAITDSLFSLKETHSFRGECNMVDHKLLKKFNSLKTSKKIDISKVAVYDKDTLIQYKEEFRKLPWKGFDKMDLLLRFSRIAFNDAFDKAIVFVDMSIGHLNGVSILVYLEKENYHWEIKCEKVLSIS